MNQPYIRINKQITIQSMDIFEDGRAFAAQIAKATGQPIVLDSAFTHLMISDEMDELLEAGTNAERIDAICDAIYYIASGLAPLGIKSVVNINLRDASLSDFIRNTYNFDSRNMILRDGMVALDDQIHPKDVILITKMHVMIAYLASFGLDMVPIWNLIHNANMSKFAEGGHMLHGKWRKPPNFIPPDDDIAIEIEVQLALKRSGI